MQTTHLEDTGRGISLQGSFPACVILLVLFANSGCGRADEGDEVVLETMTIGEESLSEETVLVDPDAEALDVVFATTISGVAPTANVIEGEVAILTEGSNAPLQSSAHLQLSLKARGLAPGDHAWHIHLGPCGSSAEVVIALSETEDREAVVGPLAVDQTGHVEVTVEVPSLTHAMVGSQSHSLHIHTMSGTDYGPSIACATI